MMRKKPIDVTNQLEYCGIPVVVGSSLADLTILAQFWGFWGCFSSSQGGFGAISGVSYRPLLRLKRVVGPAKPAKKHGPSSGTRLLAKVWEMANLGFFWPILASQTLFGVLGGFRGFQGGFGGGFTVDFRSDSTSRRQFWTS